MASSQLIALLHQKRVRIEITCETSFAMWRPSILFGTDLSETASQEILNRLREVQGEETLALLVETREGLPMARNRGGDERIVDRLETEIGLLERDGAMAMAISLMVVITYEWRMEIDRNDFGRIYD